jgi:hypothetical protein
MIDLQKLQTNIPRPYPGRTMDSRPIVEPLVKSYRSIAARAVINAGELGELI